MNAPKEVEVDHVNRKPWDNRKCNLRLCTRSENSRNTDGQVQRKSPYKGVTFEKQYKDREKPWRAYTRINGKRIWLGYYKTARLAAIAYNKYAARVFGEFACLNNV